jgi:hypothetical protein
LRNTEQNVLLNGATAYMDVLRDTAILDLRKNNIIVLEEQLRQTRDRFIVGEVTRTDVAQAESSCLIPHFDGAFLLRESKDALWDRFYMGAPQRQRRSVERYNIVKRA